MDGSRGLPAPAIKSTLLAKPIQCMKEIYLSYQRGIYTHEGGWDQMVSWGLCDECVKPAGGVESVKSLYVPSDSFVRTYYPYERGTNTVTDIDPACHPQKSGGEEVILMPDQKPVHQVGYL